MFQEIYFRNVNAIILVLPNVFFVSYGIVKCIREITRGSVMCHELTTNELIYDQVNTLYNIPSFEKNWAFIKNHVHMLIDVFWLTSASFDVATGIVAVFRNLGYMCVLGGKVLLYSSIGIGYSTVLHMSLAATNK